MRWEQLLPIGPFAVVYRDSNGGRLTCSVYDSRRPAGSRFMHGANHAPDNAVFRMIQDLRAEAEPSPVPDNDPPLTIQEQLETLVLDKFLKEIFAAPEFKAAIVETVSRIVKDIRETRPEDLCPTPKE